MSTHTLRHAALEPATPDTPGGGRRAARWRLVALLLAPLLVFGGLLLTTWHRSERLHRVQAAIVNLDKGTKINGQFVPMGRQLAATMVDRGNDNISWTLSDSADAASGLASGHYAAAVIIPENFSAAATSYAANKGSQATQATIQIESSEATAVDDPALARQIAQDAAATVNTTLTKGYLQNIYIGFNKTGQQLTTIAGGAKQLADGGSKLDSGVATASTGTAKLVSGLRQLDVAGGKLSNASTPLVTGGTTLSSGASQLASGTSQLATGATQLSSGATKLSGGAGQLAAGLTTLKTSLAATSTGNQFAPLVTGTRQLATGAQGLSAGLGQADGVLQAYANGTRTIALPTSATRSVSEAVVQQCTTQLTQGLGKGLDPALSQGLTQALTTFYEQQGVPAQQAQRMAVATAQTLTSALGPQLVQGLVPQICAAQGAAAAPVFTAGFNQGVKAGATVGHAALTTPDAGSGQSLLSGAATLATGADTLADNVAKLPAQVAAQQKQLLAGVTALSTGATQLSAGTTQLASGAKGLAGGATKLSGGATQLSSGVTQYANGVRTYTSGVTQYAGGVHQAYTGANGLGAGMIQLSQGTHKLSTGLATFSTKLGQGAKQVPTYSADDRESLSSAVANPVITHTTGALTPLASTAALLSVLALWLGALVTFMVARPVPLGVVASRRSSLRLLARAVAAPLAIAAVQALVLTTLDAVALHLSLGQTLRLGGLLVFAGIVFTLVNHALAAWLGGLGRLISVVWATALSVVGLVSAVPAVFDRLANLSPVGPTLRAARAVVSGGTGAGGGIAWLVVWLLVGFAAALTAIMRHRTVKASTLVAAAGGGSAGSLSERQ